MWRTQAASSKKRLRNRGLPILVLEAQKVTAAKSPTGNLNPTNIRGPDRPGPRSLPCLIIIFNCSFRLVPFFKFCWREGARGYIQTTILTA